MKYRVLLAVVLLAGMMLAFHGASAHQTESQLAAYGYPEVVIDISDDGVRVPGMVVSGRTLLTYRNSSSESRHAFLARLPDDLAIGDLFASGSSDAPPDWLMRGSFPGFPGEVAPGAETHAVVDLPSGLYIVVEDNTAVMAVQPAATDSASPSPVADPASSATISLFEFGFQIPDNLTRGDQVWRVVNAGRVPHELLLASVPDGTTVDDIMNHLQSGEDFGTAAGGLGWLSPGASAWTEVDLAPGTYVALCFVFDPDTGMPHAMKGMVNVFTID